VLDGERTKPFPAQDFGDLKKKIGMVKSYRDKMAMA